MTPDVMPTGITDFCNKLPPAPTWRPVGCRKRRTFAGRKNALLRPSQAHLSTLTLGRLSSQYLRLPLIISCSSNVGPFMAVSACVILGKCISSTTLTVEGIRPGRVSSVEPCCPVHPLDIRYHRRSSFSSGTGPDGWVWTICVQRSQYQRRSWTEEILLLASTKLMHVRKERDPALHSRKSHSAKRGACGLLLQT